MIGSRKCAVALAAFERFDARVFAIVSRQLVGTSEPPCASLPRALVRLLARVGSHVCFQMRALGVDLTAARVTTPVDASRRLELSTVVDVVIREHEGIVGDWDEVECADWYVGVRAVSVADG